MMSELPIVATDIRGCREAVLHKSTGLLCQPKDAYCLYKSLKFLMNNPNKILEYGKKGRLRAKELFDSEKVKKKELILLKEYINC